MGIDIKQQDIIFLDTAPFIYFFEKHETYFKVLNNFFHEVYSSGAQIITTLITYIELITLPARQKDTRLVNKYRNYLSHSGNINLLPLDITIADEIVRLRAKYGLKTPDAIQLATAITVGADYVITNDKKWKSIKGLNVLLVSEL